MKFLGNILWLILGGLLTAVLYFLAGIVLCITIIGIPFGLQLIKFGRYALWPFGREIVSNYDKMGCLPIVLNVIWVLVGWWEIAVVHLVFGLIFCITIIGIPFGLKHFKLALLSFLPFGLDLD